MNGDRICTVTKWQTVMNIPVNEVSIHFNLEEDKVCTSA